LAFAGGAGLPGVARHSDPRVATKNTTQSKATTPKVLQNQKLLLKFYCTIQNYYTMQAELKYLVSLEILIRDCTAATKITT